MKRLLIVAASVLVVSGCRSSSTNSTAPATTQDTAVPTLSPAAPGSAPSCALPNSGDYIERDVTPNLPPSALEIGGVFLPTCQTTVDALPSTSPTGQGYCTQLALASDNPGYDIDITPAPPLHRVVAEVGAGC